MKWVFRIIQGLLAIVFSLAGIMKLIGHEQQVQMFTEAFGYSLWFMYLTGIFEILVAIGFIVGFGKSQFTFHASVWSVLLMAGAAISHINAGEEMVEAMPSIILLILGFVTFIGKRTMISKKEQSNLA
ncbi:DoxX family protein [Metabacillus herbersteinensis]|uniref:DoxX family protein n=1 Tax=Metabacillus herbersteinensis TaxID=283816 RepID=A0ABV6GHS3_9BACI